MDKHTTRIDYILSVSSEEVDAALKKLKLLEKEVNIANKESLKAYREGVLRDKKYRTNIAKRHYERQDDTARMNAITKKYDAITKRKLAKSKIYATHQESLASTKKAEAYETDVASKWVYKYDELNQKRELAKQELDRKELETLNKIENEKLKQARLERESVEENIRKNEKITNMRLETARKEKEASLKYNYLNKKEDNKKNIMEQKLKQDEIRQRHESILRNKKLEQAEKRLAIQTEKLAMKRQQQERIASRKDRAGRGSRRPFESLMMMIGSFMLLQYAVKMPFMWATELGDRMASVETDSRKGKAYRESLINRGYSTKSFDEAVQRYSELSGEQGYMARKRIADIYSTMEQRKVDTVNLNPKQLANVLQGLTAGMGMSSEQADKKLAELLSGKISKEDRKTFGIKSRNPMQVLEEISTSLQSNPVTASVMREDSVVSHMNFIRGAKNELFSQIDDLWSNLFSSITGPIKEFTKTFFGLDNKDVKAEWIATLATFRDQIRKVFTKENAEKLAVFVNRFMSAVAMALGFISDFMIKQPLISAGIIGLGIANKMRTGSIFGNLFGGDYDKDKDGTKVYVTNMPKNLDKKSGVTETAITVAIVSGFKKIIPTLSDAIIYIIAAKIGWDYGKKFGTWLGEKGNRERKLADLDQEMIAARLSPEDRNKFYKEFRQNQNADVQEFIKKHATKENYERYISNKEKANKMYIDVMNDLNKPANTSIYKDEFIKENINKNNSYPEVVEPRSVFDNNGQKSVVYVNATNLYLGPKGLIEDFTINQGYGNMGV